jgi:N-acetyl-gamma-glutamyl-phosphate reductase
MEKLRVGVLGAAGYTGSELVRLIDAHPRLELAWVGGRSHAGQRLGEVLPFVIGVPGLESLVVEPLDQAGVAELAQRLDVVFCALPHGESAERVAWLYAAGLIVVDLSADFRLKNLEVYERWYGKHPVPELIAKAVYGQPEWHRAELLGARLIAAPGCYPTSALLALAPLLSEQLIETSGIIVDSKSGVSGAGRGKKPFAEVAEGFRPYSVAGNHRHVPEIEQELSTLAGSPIRVTFTPHLVPMTRGILTVAYARVKPGVSVEACRAAAERCYAGTLVTVLSGDQLPDTSWVRGSARALVAYALDAHTGILLSMCAIDNLCRGASAQAIQALNISRGWPDALGLPLLGTFP